VRHRMLAVLGTANLGECPNCQLAQCGGIPVVTATISFVSIT
jgi:hypothetical protein